MIFSKLLTISVILILLSLPALAAEYKGVIERPYSGRLDDDERAQAYAEAKLKAIEAWVAKTQESRTLHRALPRAD